MAGALLAMAGAVLARFTVGPSFRKDLARWVEVDLDAPLAASASFSRVVLEYETRDAWMAGRARKPAYVRLGEDGEVVALSAECTHLGCTVSWDAAHGQFKCPCHDGRFDSQGRAAGGPPSAPLKRHRAKLEDGRLYLSTDARAPGDESGETA
jgi:Rieske Fe-S protein